MNGTSSAVVANKTTAPAMETRDVASNSTRPSALFRHCSRSGWRPIASLAKVTPRPRPR